MDDDEDRYTIVGMVDRGPLRGIAIRQIDVRLAEQLDMEPWRVATARQPMRGGLAAMDWHPDHPRPMP